MSEAHQGDVAELRRLEGVLAVNSLSARRFHATLTEILRRRLHRIEGHSEIEYIARWIPPVLKVYHQGEEEQQQCQAASRSH